MEKALLFAKLLPVLIQLALAIEAAIPGQGSGEQKLALLRGLLEIADAKIMDNWGQIESVVAVIVKVFNKTIWKKD